MGFNNGLERKKFEARWSRLRVEYAANGMEESMITQMYEFDLREFNSNRRYAEHTQAMTRSKTAAFGKGFLHFPIRTKSF